MSQKGSVLPFLIIAVLVVALLAVGAQLLGIINIPFLSNSSTVSQTPAGVSQTTQVPPSAKVLNTSLELKTSYANPFEVKAQSTNPFDDNATYQNPLESL